MNLKSKSNYSLTFQVCELINKHIAENCCNSLSSIKHQFFEDVLFTLPKMWICDKSYDESALHSDHIHRALIEVTRDFNVFMTEVTD